MNATAKNVLVRSGRAHWLGNLANGEGRLSTDSGALHDHRYAFATRFARLPEDGRELGDEAAGVRGGLVSRYSSCQIHHSYGGVWG